MGLADETIMVPERWERTEPRETYYTSDQVIDAYLQGHKDALKQEKRLIYNRLSDNMEKTGEHTSRVLSKMKELGLTPEETYLRIDSWDIFSILIVLSEKDFLDPEMLSLYQYVSQLENEIEEEMYRFQISFCDREDEIDTEHIYSDGYMYKYKNKS